jgi:hypothetical protein
MEQTLENLIVAQLIYTYTPCMNPGALLSHSQQLAIGSYLDPD